MPQEVTIKVKKQAESILTAGAFIVLRQFGLMAATPIWVLLSLILTGSVLRFLEDKYWPISETPRQLHGRIARGMLVSTAVMYATGWGPVLAVGHMFTASANIKASGSKAAKPAILWATICTLLGQSAIVAGVAPTLIHQPLVHGLAGLGLLGAVFAIRLVGASSSEREQAEAELALTLRREQRTSNSLRKLNDAIKVVASSMDMREMLDAITRSINEALGGVFAAVLFKEEHALLAGSLQGHVVQRPDMSTLSTDAVSDDDAGPSAIAMKTGEPIVVEDFETETDPRFARWVGAVRKIGVRSMVAMPLGNPPIGVLNVYFQNPGELSAEDFELLRAFAEEVTVALARAEAFERERAAVHRLQELDEMKDDFISTVSHELRTPLTTIGGFAETLDRNWERIVDGDRRDYVQRIGRNSVEMRHLVEELLDLSRLNRNEYEPDVKPISLAAAIRECIQSISDALGSHPVEVAIDPEVRVQADIDGLKRILGNLLTNASKYSAETEPIVVSARRDQVDVVVGVADHGVGIPAEEQEKIFDRFYQGSGRKPGRSGTGVGLNIARRYVEMQGGRIWVESQLGEGSTFYFTLPTAHSTRRAPTVRSATPSA